MSLFRDLPPRNVLPLPLPLPIPPAPDANAAPIPRTCSSSRNDLFTTSWQPELPPPRPLAQDSPPRCAEQVPPAKVSAVHAHTMPMKPRGGDIPRRGDTSSPVGSTVDEFGVPTRRHRPASATVPAHLHQQHSQPTRTSSFFHVVPSTDLPSPPPAPHRRTGGNTLSRSTSLRRAPPPPLLPLARTGSHTNIANGSDRQRSWDSYTSSIPSSPSASASYATAEEDPLSPLHQSPQLPPSRTGQQADWIPPLPPAADDIKLRLLPSSTYFLGEGRYAKVYLAAYKRKRKSKLKGKRGGELLGRAGLAHHKVGGAEETKQVNEDGDGLVGGDWRLCAVKRLAPDRESQTMGLREAFFLNRLMATTTASPSSEQDDQPPRARAISPLRESFGQTPLQTPESTPSLKSGITNGSVYIIKLIAVKEDGEGPAQSSSHPAHARSASDAIKSQKTTTGNGTPTRQRSSTMLPPHSPTTTAPVDRVAAKVSAGCAKPDTIPNLSSFPSFPSLAQAIRQEYAAPSLSRLVLVLEHAPLGTLDRLLRTSPQLIGKKLWGRWAREGTEALEWVHGKGVVHADIKPGNLLVC